MKKVLFAFAIVALFASCNFSKEPKQEPKNTIIEVENLPDGECLYTVDVKGGVGYTFVDSCGKFEQGYKF